MTPGQLENLRENIDTIVRDEAYQGDYGPLNDEVFNNMAARITKQIMDLVEATV